VPSGKCVCFHEDGHETCNKATLYDTPQLQGAQCEILRLDVVIIETVVFGHVTPYSLINCDFLTHVSCRGIHIVNFHSRKRILPRKRRQKFYPKRLLWKKQSDMFLCLGRCYSLLSSLGRVAFTLKLRVVKPVLHNFRKFTVGKISEGGIIKYLSRAMMYNGEQKRFMCGTSNALHISRRSA
jgi:hypothetical protein